MAANTTYPERRSSSIWLTAICVAFGLAMLASTSSLAQSYDDLASAMKSRQAALAPYLLGSNRCLGERQDGFLEVNTNCPAEAVTLAEAENLDRRELYALMAQQLGMMPDDVGAERANREAERYKRGVLRQILVADQLTWWDGVPPRPGAVDASRILAQRYAVVHASADSTSPVVRDNLQQYEVYSVLDSTVDAQGVTWYQISESYVPKIKPPGWSPDPLGWIAGDQVIPWRRAVVMEFTTPYKRDPALFFADQQPLIDLANLPIIARETRLDSIRDAVQAGQGLKDDVLAVEPTFASDMPQAVLYPVLDFYPAAEDRDFMIDQRFARLLEIAAQASADAGGDPSAPEGGLALDIMFVMDTTQSMGPYLADVLAATESFVRSASADSAIRYGFLGYRDKHAGFEYAVKDYTPSLQTADEFLQTLREIKAETASTGDDIPEAAFDGLNQALDATQWRPGAIKAIWFVGDAPGREEDVSIRTLRDKISTRNMAVYAFHIENSKVSASFDRQAQEQYKELASLYQGSYGSSAQTAYFQRVDAATDTSFRNLVRDAFIQGKQSLDEARACSNTGQNIEQCRQQGILSQVDEGSFADLIFRQASLLIADRTMPETNIQAWVSDKVLTNPALGTLKPMILLNETELEELAERVRELKDVGETALRGEGGTTMDFWELVTQNSRWTMVDPTAVQFRDVFAAPLGINDLPYESDIMATTRYDFQNPAEVQNFVRSMELKLQHYEDLRRQRGNPMVWKRLNQGSDDRVVALELNQLP